MKQMESNLFESKQNVFQKTSTDLDLPYEFFRMEFYRIYRIYRICRRLFSVFSFMKLFKYYSKEFGDFVEDHFR